MKKHAVIVVDMVQDTVGPGASYPITASARAILPAINALTDWARQQEWPVVFANDSFLEGDFIFQGRLKPHSIRGTPGEITAEELVRMPEDTVLPKRRFSAFFKTDLDQTLRCWDVEAVLVCGISTHICVLTTALDAICHDFGATIIEDATAAPTTTIKEETLEHYRKSALFPLLRVCTTKELMEED